MAKPRCERCSRELATGGIYRVRIPGGTMIKCRRCAMLHGPMLRRSLRVALFVGVALTALNQGDVLLEHGLSGNLWWKIPLTFVVPFCVASYGALSNAREG
ncbi:MAG: nitrate/nitrite transporter NrtS [Bryobacterales bacterium]